MVMQEDILATVKRNGGRMFVVDLRKEYGYSGQISQQLTRLQRDGYIRIHRGIGIKTEVVLLVDTWEEKMVI